ncbi:SpaA isopeptide-forming pilin-related protein [Bifidobacterium callitrichidarum]|uniref:Cell surface protein n=1 Tax=Bifidobacterium callitrichidarum TaxID=2052941 RepID=A0A2U2N0G2_9BIFI|nr:SpaA isopeptide-forming pilin-related protein [Bifidobacterium callitrichidarum]PWG62552.1 hypothetical protein DF196_12070 [Bifidobacterium callitrichidarum]
MQMRKLFAGLAAVATLLGGMAFSVTTANADGETGVVSSLGDGTITLKSDNVKNFQDADGNSRVFQYIKLAGYKLTPETNTTGQTKYLTLVTNTAYETQIKDAITTTWPSETVPADVDPLVWATTKTIDETTWRTFITNLGKKLAEGTGTTLPTIKPDVTAGTDTNPATAKFDFNSTNPVSGPGLYVLLDTTTKFPAEGPNANNCTITYGKLQAMLVGTKIEDASVKNADGTLIIEGKKSNLAAGTGEPKTNITTNCKPNGYFEKTGPDGKGLQGVEFTVYKVKDNTVQDSDFVPSDKSSGSIDTNKFEVVTTIGKNGVLTSNNDGHVAINNWEAGDYYVVESGMPTGNYYLKEFRAYLKIHVEEGAKASFTITDLNPNKLLTEDGGIYRYKNVTSTSQLPKTGAEGIALFFVVAALLAGAGVTVFLKSRKTKAMLNA